ncbi:MAG: RNA polymerase sigma factor [Bacteroidaceae bacterium]|nr:RNA polymerase sigma factor [Bacteroidaceae bacterium]
MRAEEFKRLFLPYHKVLYRVAFHLTGNGQDAEDLLQDFYLRLWTKRNELQPPKNLEAYLVTMIRNLFYEQRRIRRVDFSVPLDQAGEPPGEDDISHKMEVSEEATKMEDIIHNLPDKEQKVVRLHIIEDRTYEEIEHDTGLSNANIRKLMSRAKERIRQIWKQQT